MFLYSRVTLSQNPLQLVIGILFPIFLYEYFQSSIVQFVRISVLGCLVLFVSLSYVTYFPSLHPTLSSCVCSSYMWNIQPFFHIIKCVEHLGRVFSWFHYSTVFMD